MLGRESLQRSFFDAALAVEGLLDRGSFYELLYRLGPQLISDDDFADCYDFTTGRPSAPPARMFKMLLLQAYERLSDREAVERMAFDLRWKAVLGLEVDDRPVAQSTLVEHRARIQLHAKMEMVYGRFVRRLVDSGVIAADQVQVLDSTAIWGRGAVKDTYNLIGSAILKLLGVSAKRRGRSSAELAAELGLRLAVPAENGSLKGRAEMDWSDLGQRREFLNRLVEEARTALRIVGEANSEDHEVLEAASLLKRILVQDLEAVATAEKPPSDRNDGQAVLELGQEVLIRKGVAEDRIISVSDPEMRRGHKSHNRSWDGYKAHVSVEASHGFITAVELTPANVADAQAAPALLEAQRAVGLKPTACVGDMAYSAAELRQQAQEQGIEIIARVPPSPGAPGCFRKEDFRIDLEAGEVTCPAGVTTRHVVSRSPDGARLFVFAGSICGACSLRSKCLKNPQKIGLRGRTITIHSLETILQAARAAENTERFRDLLKLRWMAERGIAHSVRRGLREARYFGTRKGRYQTFSAVLTTNLARFARIGGPAGPAPCPA